MYFTIPIFQSSAPPPWKNKYIAHYILDPQTSWKAASHSDQIPEKEVVMVLCSSCIQERVRKERVGEKK